MVFRILYVVVMVAAVVLVDAFFLRGHGWVRLGVNVGVVAVFIAAYVLFFRKAFSG